MTRPAADPLNNSLVEGDAWRELFRSICGRYNPEGIDPRTFSGWVRPRGVYGLTALDVGANARRVERTRHDIRLDGADDYFLLCQVAGEAAVTHNDEVMRLSPGGVVLVDATLPLSYIVTNESVAWNCVALSLPRRTLISQLGFDPHGGNCGRRETAAGRLLFDLMQDIGR